MQPNDDKLKVMQLLPALDGGGVERGTIEVSQALCAQGHKSIVVSSGGRLVQEVTQHGGEHVTLNLLKKSPVTLASIPRLRRLILQHRPDVVHARSRVPAWVGRLTLSTIPRGKRPAWVTSVHGLHSVNRYSAIMTSGQRVEVVSETARDYALKNYPSTDPDKLFLNYRGVDPDQFPFGYQPAEDWQRDWQAQYPHLSEPYVIALAGRLTRLKGHHDLIQAIAGLRDRAINAHGLIVGGEDPRRQGYARELRETVTAKQLDKHITFTGHRSDIRDVLAVSDATVSLSTKPESFGRSTLEAIRLGKPVVGYDHGGVGEVLGATYPEGLVALNDVDALIDRISSLASGQTAPPVPGDQFLLRDMLDRSLELYRLAAN